MSKVKKEIEEKSINLKKTKEANILKILFILSSIIFAIPSIIYLIENKTIYKFEPYFKYLLNNNINTLYQTFIYIIILAILTVIYYLIIKTREEIFKTKKEMYIFILIISLIFVLVVPFVCSDVFYYLGIGRLDSTYNQNPYYVTIKDYVEQGNNIEYLSKDTVLAQGYINDWSDSTVVYGPIWTLICKIVATFSFGNIDIGLLIFKLINVIVHLLNCHIIYKLSNKKIFTLLYGLNPFILIEGIAQVHNDMFVLLFALLSLYFLIKKRNLILSIIFLALATTIKYFTIILLPFIIIYYFRKEKPLKRFYKCIKYGLLFLFILIIPYLLYIKDMQVLSGLFIQQEKLAKSFYIIITSYFNNPQGIVGYVKDILLGSFIIIYFFTCLVLINKKEIKLRKEMQKANYFIMAFLFLLITNFQPWYIIWLFILLIWQKSQNIKWIIQISLIVEFANSVFLTYGEGWQYGTPFTFIFIVASLTALIINEETKKKRQVKAFLKRKV